MTTTYHCKHCGRGIFHADALIDTVDLWDLGDYQAGCYMIKGAIDEASLRRYDVSLHEGWYCCRFIMMRMVVDKFGTGDALLVYQDAVVPVSEGETPPAAKPAAALQLSSRDFDAVIASELHRDQLLMVKLGAIWCPPCRMMDTVIGQIVEDGQLPEVRFFELDIDAEPEIASRFRNQSIPYSVFYLNGRQVPVPPGFGPVLDGGLLGGLRRTELLALCEQLLAGSTLATP